MIEWREGQGKRAMGETGSAGGPAIVWPAGRVEMLYERFKKQIIDRAWPPGQPLNIARLAVDYGVSITPVREALARLSADRLVVASPNRGYTVSPPPTAARMAELFTVRLLLEPHAARGAAARLTPDDLVDLRALNERLAGSTAGEGYHHTQGYADLNRVFHQQIFRVNGNGALSEVYDGLNYHVLIGYLFSAHGVTDLPEVVAEHTAIIEALAAGDAAAAEAAMHTHIERGSIRLLATYGVT